MLLGVQLARCVVCYVVRGLAICCWECSWLGVCCVLRSEGTGYMLLGVQLARCVLCAT